MRLYLVALIGAASMASAEAEYLGSYRWERPEERHGGYSGIEVLDQGRRFLVIGDNGQLVQGRFERDGDAIVAMPAPYIGGLQSPTGAFVGTIPKRGEIVGSDSEDISLAPNGDLIVAFESDTRVWRYSDPEGPARALPRHGDFAKMPLNGALESVAVDENGILYAIPETAEGRGDFPVYVFRRGAWSIPFSLPRDGAFKPTAADFGPDGRLYVLERLLRLPFGFASRVRSFEVANGELSDPVTHLRSAFGAHDNLEGLSVWLDEEGAIRLTMISDDNYNVFQITEVVEYRLTANPGAE